MRIERRNFIWDCALLIVIALVSATGCIAREPLVPAEVSGSATVPPTPPPHYLPLYTSSIVVMQKEIARLQDRIPGMALAVPDYLPEGFFFTEGTLAEGEGIWIGPGSEGYCLLSFRRGQDEWINLQERLRNQTPCQEIPQYQAAAPGTLLANKGGTGEIWWGGDGWCYNLSGSVPREDLEKVAASVKPAPYREGVLPPHEFQPPPSPLLGIFAVNRSATAEGLTVTVESLQCTPQACTALMEVKSGSPPGRSLSPEVTPAPPAGYGPHAEWRADGGRSLLTMPGGGVMFNTTSITWKIEPLPSGSRELSVNFSRLNGISGHWQVTIPLANQSGTGEQETILRSYVP